MRSLAIDRLLVAALVLAWCVPPVAAKDPSVEGERLEFRLHDLDGNPVGSDDPRFEGRVLLVDLWGSWCPPCITEIPTFVDLQARYGEAGLLVVAIAFEGAEEPDERRAILRRIVEKQEINYLVLDGGSTDDFEAALPAVENVRGFPVEILVDRTGRVVDCRNGYGYKKRWARKLERELVELLGTAD